MSNKHLRPTVGGDPARAVSTDLKNQPTAPRDGNDFPDAPDEDPSESPQDKPDLDAFAQRLGTDTISTGDGLDAVPDERSATPTVADTARRPILIGALVVAGLLTVVAGRRRRRRRSTLAKAAASGLAATAILD